MCACLFNEAAAQLQAGGVWKMLVRASLAPKPDVAKRKGRKLESRELMSVLLLSHFIPQFITKPQLARKDDPTFRVSA